jgi:hypothetical protein
MDPRRRTELEVSLTEERDELQRDTERYNMAPDFLQRTIHIDNELLGDIAGTLISGIDNKGVLQYLPRTAEMMRSVLRDMGIKLYEFGRKE